MIRTNIYLPKDLHEKLHRLSQQEHISMAQLVREFTKQGIVTKTKQDGGVTSLLRMAANARPSGIRDLAKNHDYYLYKAFKKRK